MYLIKTYLPKYVIKASDYSQFQKNGIKCGKKLVIPHNNVEQDPENICISACVEPTSMKTYYLHYKSMLHFWFRRRNGGGGHGEIYLSRAIKKNGGSMRGLHLTLEI